MVPFAAVAALRPRPPHWPGDGLQGIVPFDAAAALRPRPSSSRWSGDVLQGAMPFAAVAALRCHFRVGVLDRVSVGEDCFRVR